MYETLAQIHDEGESLAYRLQGNYYSLENLYRIWVIKALMGIMRHMATR